MDNIVKKLKDMFVNIENMPINEFKELIEEADIEYKKINIICDDFIMQYRNKNGRLDSENDFPAYINKFGSQFWYKNGELHREGDKPAVIFANGQKEWYMNNQLHRSKLPAIIYVDGTVEYWENGRRIK